MTKKAESKKDDKQNPVHVETTCNLPETSLLIKSHGVTEQTKSRENATWHKENLDALINNIEDYIWSIDKDFKILSANNSFKQTIKQTTGRDIHIGDSIFVPEIPDKGTELWTKYYRRALNGEVLQFVDLIQFEGHEPYFTETKLSPICTHEEVVGVVCISSNIQERLENQKKTTTHNKKLTELISIASHEIRGPVTSVLGLINLFNLNDHSDPFNAEIITLIEKTTKQLDSLIHQFVAKTYNLQQEYQIKDSFPHNQSENE